MIEHPGFRTISPQLVEEVAVFVELQYSVANIISYIEIVLGVDGDTCRIPKRASWVWAVAIQFPYKIVVGQFLPS